MNMITHLNKLKHKSFFNNFSLRNFCVVLTHTGPNKMVNVGSKSESFRYAKASCIISMNNTEVIEHIRNNTNSKGDVFRISEISGILAAKKTSELIPLCHQINLNTVNIKIEIKNETHLYLESYAETSAKTGVEMEAMVGVSMAALTIYDMCKAADKGIKISEIKLIEKFGGKSGHYKL